MADIVEFKRREDEPDAAHVSIVANDGKPEKWFEFIAHFEANDGTYSFTFWAKDADDAEHRMKALKATAKVSGQIFASIPV